MVDPTRPRAIMGRMDILKMLSELKAEHEAVTQAKMGEKDTRAALNATVSL